MDYSHLLVTGGSGLLGRNLKPLLPGAWFPTRDEFNITDPASMRKYVEGKSIGTVFHGAAFTSPPKINENPGLALESNIVGTALVVQLCREIGAKLVYVSTDYVFAGSKGNYKEDDEVLPANKYAWSKLGGECAVRMYDNSLILRTSFGEMVFPYEKAFVDQWTSRLRVDQVAQKMVKAIDSDVKGVLHLGGIRQTVFDYARSVSPDKKIGELSLKDVTFVAPRDTSLDTTRYQTLIENALPQKK